MTRDDAVKALAVYERSIRSIHAAVLSWDLARATEIALTATSEAEARELKALHDARLTEVYLAIGHCYGTLATVAGLLAGNTADVASQLDRLSADLAHLVRLWDAAQTNVRALL